MKLLGMFQVDWEALVVSGHDAVPVKDGRHRAAMEPLVGCDVADRDAIEIVGDDLLDLRPGRLSDRRPSTGSSVSLRSWVVSFGEFE